MEFQTAVIAVLIAQVFINIGYLINLTNRVTKIETHLLYLMKAHNLDVSQERKILNGG